MKEHFIKKLLATACAALMLCLPLSNALAFSADDYGEDIEAEDFYIGDATVDVLAIGKSSAAEVYARMGEPDKTAGEVVLATGAVNVVWTYSGAEFTLTVNDDGVSSGASLEKYQAAADKFAKADASGLDAVFTGITVTDASMTGPHAISVGMSFEDVLVHFPDEGNEYDEASASRVLYSAGSTATGALPPSGVIYDLGTYTDIVFTCPADSSAEVTADNYLSTEMLFLRISFCNTKVISYSLSMGMMS